MQTLTESAWTPDLARRFLSRARASDAEWLRHALTLLYEQPKTNWAFPPAAMRSQNVILRDGGAQFAGLPAPVIIQPSSAWSLDGQFRAAWDKLMEEEG